jgi:hypothetical protein
MGQVGGSGVGVDALVYCILEWGYGHLGGLQDTCGTELNSS